VQEKRDGIRLEWPGRAWKPGASPTVRPASETLEAGDDAARVILGDALDVSALLAERGERAHLVYIDPPYASQTDYVSEARLDGVADGRTRRTKAFADRWSVPEYLSMLAPRLEAAARLLHEAGSLWVHLDWRSAYLVRVVLDEIFGREGFKNEIVWRRAPNLGRQAASGQFGRTLDTILVYGGEGAAITPPTRRETIEPRAVRFDEAGRPFTTAPRGDYTDASIAKLEAEGRVHRTASGRVYIKYFLTKDDAGGHYRERRVDALWTDVAPLRHAKTSERTGYPTQKPLALLDRIVRCACPAGGLVVDVFCGSGTTAEAAVLAGRRAVVSDKSPLAVATARARLMRAGITPTLEHVTTLDVPRGDAEAHVDKRDAGVRVTLSAPTMPLAWAIDARGTDDAFQATWHAERSLGRADTLPAFADVMTPKGAIRVRAWGDDGTLFEAKVWP
jgi:DNA modification methylase